MWCAPSFRLRRSADDLRCHRFPGGAGAPEGVAAHVGRRFVLVEFLSRRAASLRGPKLALIVFALSMLSVLCILCIEAQRSVPVPSWFQLSVGLGLGSQAGIRAGFFPYDARLETQDERAFIAPAGVVVGSDGDLLRLGPISD